MQTTTLDTPEQKARGSGSWLVGTRIGTLMHIKQDVARVFGNFTRKFAHTGVCKGLMA
jgi:hypothetical protein